MRTGFWHECEVPTGSETVCSSGISPLRPAVLWIRRPPPVLDGNLFPSRPSKVGREESADATSSYLWTDRWRRTIPSSRIARTRLGMDAFEHNQGGQPMEQDLSTSITRRSLVAGLALSAAPVALAGANNACAQAKETTSEKSLYERLGGVFAIAAVVDHFSDAVVKNPVVGQKSKNPQLREWHTKNLKGCPASSSCARCGSATFRVGPSSSPLPSPARRRSALRRPTAIFESPGRIR